MLRGLKIEKNAVFTRNDNSEIWEKVNFTAIPKLEELLKKLDGVTYSKEDKKEDFVFENEVNIGPGTIKSSRDEDGDIVITYRKENSIQMPTVINEDFDFELDEGHKEVEKERKLVNFWSTNNNTVELQEKPATFVEKTEVSFKKTAMKKTSSRAKKLRETINASPTKNIIFDVSSEKPLESGVFKDLSNKGQQAIDHETVDIFNRPVKHMGLLNRIINLTVSNPRITSFKIKARGDVKIEKKVAQVTRPTPPVRMVIPKIIKPPIVPLTYFFKKRLLHSAVTNGGRALQNLLRGIDQIKHKNSYARSSSYSSARAPLYSDKNLKKEISFIKRTRWDNKERKHADFLRLILQAKKKAENFDATYMKFQLEEVPLKAKNDEDEEDDFDRLLQEAANGNVE